MSAAALRSRVVEPAYEPEPVCEAIRQIANDRGYTIGAHADYCRDDFIFPRMQSREMRSMPWENRMRPLRSWCEIAATGLLFGLASVLLAVGVTSFV